jgi:hypothetical protein
MQRPDEELVPVRQLQQQYTHSRCTTMHMYMLNMQHMSQLTAWNSLARAPAVAALQWRLLVI